jgi:hypothetical protein
MNPTLAQLPVRPRLHGPQSPHEIWNGTLTRSHTRPVVAIGETPALIGAGNSCSGHDSAIAGGAATGMRAERVLD